MLLTNAEIWVEPHLFIIWMCRKETTVKQLQNSLKKMRAVSIVLSPMLGLVVMMGFIQDQVRKLTPY